jgi:hypothetical protein
MPSRRDHSRDDFSVYRKAIVTFKALAVILTLTITALLYLLIFKLKKGINDESVVSNATLIVSNATSIEPYSKSKINNNTNSMQ